MSTGAFIFSRYRSWYTTDVHPIRIQPETLTLTIGTTSNAAPTAAVDNNQRVVVSGGRRIGIRPRKLGVRITDGGENDYLVGSVIYVPWLNDATFFTVAAQAGATGTYNGAQVEVIGNSPEFYKP